MARLIAIISLFCITLNIVSGQLKLSDPNHSVTLLDLKTFPIHPTQDATILPSDTEYEKLFKSYFNPASFDHYKSFFLPVDWGGFSREEFESWQARIRKDKLYLHYALHIQATDGREFIVCQYVMESTAFSIPESVKFKKVQGAWKHIHVRHDDIFSLLHQIGDMRIEFLQQAVQQKQTNIRVEQIPDQFKVVTAEKFDRHTVFKQIESILTADGLSAMDLDRAKNYFLQKDDQAFVEWVTLKSGKPDFDFMQMVNETTGMRLFNFTKAQND